MRRRNFVKTLLAATGALTCRPDFINGFPAADAPEIKRVLVMFKCHLDVGFADTQATIMREYFEEYFPHAIEVAASMRQSSGDRYVWTTGSWLLYEYLEQASSDVRDARNRPWRRAIWPGTRCLLPGKPNSWIVP